MKREGIPGHPEVAKRLKQARVGAGLTQTQLAVKVSALVDTIVGRSLISRTELAERDAETRLVWAIAQVTGESMDWLLEPLNKLRDPGESNPGYTRSDADATRLHAEYVNPELAHAPGEKCFDCIEDADAHVLAEWMTPGGEIPGQFTIDLRDESLERFLQGAA